jgi:hypothetical protein
VGFLLRLGGIQQVVIDQVGLERALAFGAALTAGAGDEGRVSHDDLGRSRRFLSGVCCEEPACRNSATE